MPDVQDKKAAGFGIITVIMKDTGHLTKLEYPRETTSHYVGHLKGKNQTLVVLYRTDGATEWTRNSPRDTDRF